MFDFSGFRCKKLHPNAVLPHKEEGDAGYDMHSVEEVKIPAGCWRRIKLGFSAELPYATYCQLKDRSSNANAGLVVWAGVIDPSYRGEWMVVIFNAGPHSVTLEAGYKICQGVCRRFANPTPSWVDELTDTDRGAGGFGSTGR